MSIIKPTPVCRARLNAGVLTVVFDNPPVNAISAEVRAAVADVIDVATANNVRAVVFCARGRTFFSGADIREFDRPAQGADLPTTLAKMDACPAVLIAVMHGTVFGGGLEFALRCDIRLAYRDCRFAFPEVNLGLIPGAGGTQLLPRLIEVEAAIDLISGGRPVDCTVACDSGLVDRLLPHRSVDVDDWCDWIADEIEFDKLALNKRRLVELAAPTMAPDNIERLRKSIGAKARGQHSPMRAFAAITDGLGAGSVEAGLKNERAVFLECKASAQSKALRHIFFAEKSSAKLNSPESSVVVKSTDLSAGVKAQEPHASAKTADSTVGVQSSASRSDRAQAAPFSRCAVVGCGTMGAGIGAALLRAADSIVLIDAGEDTLARAHQTVLGRLDKMRQRGQVSEQRCQELRQGIECSTDIAAAAGADMVIEAVFEDKAVKRDVFARLADVTGADTILATNTSYIDPNEIFAGVPGAHRCVGLHFFSPADVMKLLEIVVLGQTDTRTLATAAALAKKTGKTAVFARPAFGFAANSSYMAYGRAVQDLLLAGNTPTQIDEAMTGFGMAMGPLAVLDMSGIDIGHRGRQHNPYPPDDAGFYLPASILVERGELGRKSDAGFYRYANGKPTGVNEEALQAYTARARALGIEHCPRSADEIVTAVMGALTQECQRLVSTGVCQRPEDMDVIWVNGYGFPRWRGGPMYWHTSNSDTSPAAA